MIPTRIFVTVVAAFLLSSIEAKAGSAPAEFVNIEWKAKIADAKRSMAQREGVSLKEESSERLVYQGGTFATHPVERWVLEFPHGLFQSGTVYVTIPTGNAKNGVPNRNQQFEDYYKSLNSKYGKGVRLGDRDHAQATWTWMVSDPRSGLKDAVSVLLSYAWNPYEFKIKYSSLPQSSTDIPVFGKPVQKGDL